MAFTFLSHRSSDRALAVRVCDALTRHGFDSVFLSSDPEHGIGAGEKWEQELYREMRKASVVVFVDTAAARASRWCFAELILARALNKPIIPVKSGRGRHPLLRELEFVTLSDDHRLVKKLEKIRRQGAAPFPWSGLSPFPGLKSFEREYAGVFFARELEIDRVLERLTPVRERFLGVVGPSGSGKSSVVRAGVIPWLEHPDQTYGHWLVLPAMVPTTDPVAALARVIAQTLSTPGDIRDHTHTRETLKERSSDGLVSLIDELRVRAGVPDLKVLLFVDQAEELMHQVGAQERADFLEIVQGALERDRALWALCTIRSEFLSSAPERAGISRVIGEQVLIEAIAQDHLSEVIEGPAERAGLELQPGLVHRMVQDTVSGDALPMLAYTLSLLHSRAMGRHDNTITMSDYEAIGGIEGALRRKAEEVRDELSAAGDAETVLPTLTLLATLDTDEEPRRRRFPLRSLTPEQSRVIDAYKNAWLVRSCGEGAAATVEVAHEALLRQWDPLADEIRRRGHELRLRSEIERLARDWLWAKRSDVYLATGERLHDLQEWALANPEELKQLSLVREFLGRSARRERAALERASEVLTDEVLAGFPDDPELGLLLGIAAVDHYGMSDRTAIMLTSAMRASPLRAVTHEHSRLVNAVAWSPDGVRFATASADGTARIWTNNAGDSVRVLEGHTTALTALAWSPDGKWIATASEDRTARIWSVRGNDVVILREHGAAVRAVAWSPDNKHLATACDDGAVRIWNARGGAPIAEIRHDHCPLYGVAWSARGDRLFTAGDDRSVHVWDITTYERVDVLRGHGGTVSAVACAPQGTAVATGSDDRSALIWDIDSAGKYRCIQKLTGHTRWVRSVAFSPDARCVATAADDRTACVWDLASGGVVQELRGHRGAVLSIAWSPKGNIVATGSNDRTARLWDVSEANDVALGTAGGSWIRFGAWSKDSTRVVTCGDDNVARIWDASSGRELVALRGHRDAVLRARFDHAGSRVATASDDGKAVVWDVATGKRLYVFGAHDGRVLNVAWSPDGSRLLTTSDDHTAYVWMPGGKEPPVRLRNHTGAVWAGSWSVDGDRVLTAGDDCRVVEWDPIAGVPLSELVGHEGAVRCVEYAPHKRDLAVTTSDDGTARVWDVARSETLVTVRRHRGAVVRASWAPNGQRIITASDDTTAQIWDSADGRLVAVRHHPTPMRSAEWSPDGTRILSVFNASVAWIWPTPAEVVPSARSVCATARRRVFRDLTDDERTAFGLPVVSPQHVRRTRGAEPAGRRGRKAARRGQHARAGST